MILKHLPWLLVGLPLLATVILAGLVAFGTAPPPPPMPSVTAVAISAGAQAPQPPLQRFAARDGAALAYRSYLPPTADPARVAVLIHGSGGSSADMNLLGRDLAARGVPAFSPDIRGHGDSGAWGDIGHLGQLEEDLADLVAVIRKTYPDAALVLVGHSSGGGFVLRVAGEPQGRMFARFVLLAPYLGHAAATTRPGSGGWVASYTGRIVGLSILNGFGVHAFDGLPTLAFAMPVGAKPRTWSFRLMANFAPSDSLGAGDRQGYRADAAKAPGPVVVLAGDHDEIMFADRYAGAFANLPVPVTILPGVGHMGLISGQAGISAACDAILGGTAPAPGSLDGRSL